MDSKFEDDRKVTDAQLNPRAQAFMERLQAASRASNDFSGISQWLIDNTTDPRDQGKNWSFKDHEFQEQILNDGTPHLVCRKCSQVGLSEVVVRLQLALLAIFPSTTAIYTLPTTSFARKFTKSRIDPVIDQSKVLKAMVPSGNDSSELKQLGNSFLYIVGSFGQGSAISIPADVLINDEVDFSNQQALTTFASRLGHAQLGDGKGIRREFSTPTVDGFGISKTFEISTKNHYCVKCDSCHKWVAPDFFDDVMIPGYDAKIIDFDKNDLQNPSFKTGDAFLSCPECRAKLTQANLCNKEKRQWIAKCPDANIAGYQVFPYDVPSINPVHKTLAYMNDYEKKADWVNFKVGLSFQDAETSFLKERILRYTDVYGVTPRAGCASGCVMGVDVGKTSWVVIAKRMEGQLRVIHMERIKQDGEDYLGTRLQELVDWFGVVKGVIDAAPDFSTALKLISRNHIGRIFGNYYIRQLKGRMTDIMVDDSESMIKSVRTGTIDVLVKWVNGGIIRFPKCNEMDLMTEHLENLKRVSEMNNEGELIARWINTGQDHYGHALNYLRIADSMIDYRGKNPEVPALPMAGTCKVKSGDELSHPLMNLDRNGRNGNR